MRLVSNWKRVLCHAWSIRILLLAGILGMTVPTAMFGESMAKIMGWFRQ